MIIYINSKVCHLESILNLSIGTSLPYWVKYCKIKTTLFLVQENPFQQAARQQRSGSVSSSAGGSSSDISSTSTSYSCATSPFTSQEVAAVAIEGVLFCIL
jgi:hypothetical protein